MRAVSRAELTRAFRSAGWRRDILESIPPLAVHRLLVREPESPSFAGGAHRSVRIPGETEPQKIAIADRPRLGSLIPRALREAGARAAVAAVPEGAYWIHNKGLSAYLRKVPDAAGVIGLLRRMGLTDRFRGGFLIRSHELDTVVPVLASQPFCGGPDVLFASIPAALLVTACHEFDVHFETTDLELATRLNRLVEADGLEARGMEPARAAEDQELENRAPGARPNP